MSTTLIIHGSSMPESIGNFIETKLFVNSKSLWKQIKLKKQTNLIAKQEFYYFWEGWKYFSHTINHWFVGSVRELCNDGFKFLNKHFLISL